MKKCSICGKQTETLTTMACGECSKEYHVCDSCRQKDPKCKVKDCGGDLVIPSPDTILINKMFVGEYLEESGNIGHEVINLFPDDSEHFNIYILPDGKIADCWKNKIKAVFLVRAIGTAILEVIAKVVLSDFEKEFVQEKFLEAESKESSSQKVDFMDKAGVVIRYSGKNLYEIFEDNTFHGQRNVSEIPATFRVPCKQYYIPTKPVYICKDEVSATILIYDSIKVVIQHTQFRQKRYFVNSGEVQDDYKQLSDLLSRDIWTPVCGMKRDKDSYLPYKDHFLTLIGKVYDELSYSNMIAHYLRSNVSVLVLFLIQLLKLKVGPSSSWNVYREKNNIDILIETDYFSVIIENKIRSGINGVKKDGSSQLSEYIDKVMNRRKVSYGQIYTLILLPDYVNLDLSSYTKCINGNNNGNYPNLQYRVVRYSELKRFFASVAPMFAGDKNFNAFLEALGFHSEKFDSYFTNLMIGRFLSKL